MLVLVVVLDGILERENENPPSWRVARHYGEASEDDRNSMTTLGQIGEIEAIRRITRRLPPAAETVVGIGDDAAVLRVEGSHFDWVLTTDPVVEGVHFLPGAPAAGIGHKAVGRVLSDLAAMGGEPLWVLIDVVAPKSAPVTRLEGIYSGAVRLARKYGAAIVGGDLSQGPVLELHAFGVGRVPAGQAVRRSGARQGDAIYVTGALGGSLRGRHLAFEPRVAEGIWLREQSWPTAMIDVSDGLATDLRHILEMSRAGAEIELARVPVAAAAKKPKGGRQPAEHALFDGEDFELLFTVPDGKKAFFESAWKETFSLPCTRIGRIAGRKGVIACVDAKGRRTTLKKAGFEHFSARRLPDPGGSGKAALQGV